MSKYSLVLWIHSNETSIVTTLAVADKRMLTDSERVGKVKWMDDEKKSRQKAAG